MPLSDADEAVMLVPEPENPHDEHAVAVKLMDGTTLGYVPRHTNQCPIYLNRGHVSFGHLRSVGSPSSNPEMRGAQVRPLSPYHYQPHLKRSPSAI